MRAAGSPAHEPAHGAAAVADRLAGSLWAVPLVGVAVFALQLFAVLLRPADAVVSAWWPAAGVAIAATILAPGRRRWAVLAAVAVASMASPMVAGRPPVAGLWLVVISCSEAAIAGHLLIRAGRPELRTVSDLRRLLVVLLAAALVSGGLGALSIVLRFDGNPWTTWWAVAASHGAAALILVPQVMVLPEPGAARRPVETVALWSALIISILAVFAPGQRLSVAFLPVAALVCSGLRLSIRTVSAQLVVTGVLASALTVQGGGPFAAARSVAPETPGGLVQLFLVVCALVAFALIISVAHRDAAIAALADQLRFGRAMVDVLDVGVVACDAAGAVVMRNAAHRRLLGVADGQQPAPGGLACVFGCSSTVSRWPRTSWTRAAC
jgi:integral membrane sensor domain MASE1